MGNPPFEYVSPIKNGGFPLLWLLHQRVLLVDMNLGYHGYQVAVVEKPSSLMPMTKSLLLSKAIVWCICGAMLADPMIAAPNLVCCILMAEQGHSKRIHGLNGRLVSHQMPFHPTKTSFENWSIGWGVDPSCTYQERRGGIDVTILKTEQ